MTRRWKARNAVIDLAIVEQKAIVGNKTPTVANAMSVYQCTFEHQNPLHPSFSTTLHAHHDNHTHKNVAGAVKLETYDDVPSRSKNVANSCAEVTSLDNGLQIDWGSGDVIDSPVNHMADQSSVYDMTGLQPRTLKPWDLSKYDFDRRFERSYELIESSQHKT